MAVWLLLDKRIWQDHFGQAPKALLKPISGDIFINGINTKETTAAKLARTVGLVFQNPNDQIFKNKVLDEVMFGPLNIGQSMEKRGKMPSRLGNCLIGR